MAKLGITIEGNFDEAAADFKKLGKLTEAEAKRMEKQLKKLQQFESDAFIQKNKRVALSVKATRGTVAGLVTEQRGLERQIQRMIRNGIDPLDDKLADLRKEYKRTTAELEKHNQKTKTGIKTTARNAIIGITALALAVNAPVQAFSKLEEATSKFNVVFSGVTRDMAKDVEVLRKSFAMSTREARQNLASMQDLLVPMGMNKQAAAGLSVQMVKMAADLGSFNNIPTANVMRDMQAAITGSGETMKKYGIVLTAANIQQKALEMGLAKTKNELTAAHKAQAAFALITAGSTAAMGDMARTADSFANQQKFLKAQLEDFLASLGKLFIPIAKTVISLLSGIMSIFDAMGDEMKEKIAIIAGIAGALMLAAKASKMMGGSFVAAFSKLKTVLAAHPIFALTGIIAGLVVLFSDAGKSIADFDNELKQADKTIKDIDESMKNMGQSTDQMTTQTASNVVKADKQYRKLLGSLGELRGKVADAWEAFKNDPTKVNLANAQRYTQILKKSELALKKLGEVSGRSGQDISKSMRDAGIEIGGITVSTNAATAAIKRMGDAAIFTKTQVIQFVDAMGRGDLTEMMRIVTARSQNLAKVSKAAQAAAGRRAGGTGRSATDLTQRIQDLRTLNDIRLSFDNDYERKRANMIFQTHQKEQQLIKDLSVTREQRMQMVAALQQKLSLDLHDLELANIAKQQQMRLQQIKKDPNMGADQKIQAIRSQMQQILQMEQFTQSEKQKIIEASEKAITQIQQDEMHKRNALIFAGLQFVSQAVGQIVNASAALQQARAQQRIAKLNEAFEAEVSQQRLTDSQKEKLEEAHAKKIAGIEYQAALKSWRLQLLAAKASGAQAILNGFNTRPFIPAGLAAGALATGLTIAQISTVKESKPRLSAETGGRFSVPESGVQRVDSQTLAVNPGETVDIFPRGDEPSRTLNLKVMFGKRVLVEILQEIFDNGEVTITDDNVVVR